MKLQMDRKDGVQNRNDILTKDKNLTQIRTDYLNHTIIGDILYLRIDDSSASMPNRQLDKNILYPSKNKVVNTDWRSAALWYVRITIDCVSKTK